MPKIERIAETAAASSTLFGGSPSQTYAPLQGSVYLYQDSSCSLPLSNSATPLIVGQCLNAPISGIQGASLSSLPSCDDYGTPLLIVSNVPDCKNSTVGSSADSGVVGKCEAFSSGTDIGSMELVCFGNGISSVSRAAAATSTAYNNPVYTPPASGSQGGSNTNTSERDDDDDSGGCCGDGCPCCCCVVM